MQKISDFINFALFDPSTGYYRTKNPIGKNSDFITAPEISQTFGELVAAYLLHIAATKEKSISLVEMGAGKGTWFKDILTSIQKLADKKITQALDFLERTTFHIIEINEVLAKVQRENLSEFAVKWHESFADFLNQPFDKLRVTSSETSPSICHPELLKRYPEPVKGSDQQIPKEIFFISNELFDCFAIDQFIKTADGWREKMVEKIDGKNQFTLAKFEQETHDFVESKITSAAPIDAVFEYSKSARNFMAQLCQALKEAGGMAIIIDYGYAQTEFVSTLQAIKNHQKTSVLENVGESDITALVDFSALQKIAENFELSSSLISQREFLLGLGIEKRREILLQKKSTLEQKEINSAIDRLIDPNQMGELFKTLIIWKK
jgi:NADH dehydrogenase [ubiquinone] 1 alpha subcomplex assembly factor 7